MKIKARIICDGDYTKIIILSFVEYIHIFKYDNVDYKLSRTYIRKLRNFEYDAELDDKLAASFVTPNIIKTIYNMKKLWK